MSLSKFPRKSSGGGEQEQQRHMEEVNTYMGKAVEVLLTGHFYSVTISPTTVAANTTSEQTFTVNGVKTSDIIVINKPSHQAGLGIVGARASAANTVAIVFMNTTGSGIDPSSEAYKILVVRQEKE